MSRKNLYDPSNLIVALSLKEVVLDDFVPHCFASNFFYCSRSCGLHFFKDLDFHDICRCASAWRRIPTLLYFFYWATSPTSLCVWCNFITLITTLSLCQNCERLIRLFTRKSVWQAVCDVLANFVRPQNELFIKLLITQPFRPRPETCNCNERRTGSKQVRQTIFRAVGREAP